MNTKPVGPILLAIQSILLSPLSAASYGTLCNFDTVNETGEECHGFEIELEDCHTTDVTYTYNYNHYGVPKISEDNSDPLHPRCFVRWEATRNPDGSWSAYTAIPDGPIDPTNGHQFTNPSLNFGGEHFGVSYRNAPGAVHYFWLVDRGGVLVRGAEEVAISTPVFTYNPPNGGQPGGVVARVEPVEPPEVNLEGFGPAVWVKSIVTTSHNNHKVRLEELRSDDPEDPNDVNWRNGEEDEVEVEWDILQQEFDKFGLPKGDELEGAEEPLEEGDEIITRRWEFYKYAGPVNPEDGEALADKVAEDGIHGEGTAEIDGQEVDLSDVVIVGDYLGSQMAAFDVDPAISLCDLIQSGTEDEAYPERLVVFGGNSPFTASLTGELPPGMNFDEITGILSGTPAEAGEFEFTIEASDATIQNLSQTYQLIVAPAGAVVVPSWTVDAGLAEGATGGMVAGGGTFDEGDEVTLTATSAPGYRFHAWTEFGAEISASPSIAFTASFNRAIVAVFHPVVEVARQPANRLSIVWPADSGWTLQESPLNGAAWLDSTAMPTETNGMNTLTIDPAAGASSRFFRLVEP